MNADSRRTAFVEGISLWASRLPGWDIAAAVLAGKAEPPAVAARRPIPEMLPPAERRRAPDSVALAIEVAARACAASTRVPAQLPSVFATTHADLATTDYLCETLVRTPLLVSPTRFHNSVHNAAAGYWCIASHCHAPYMTVSVFEHSFATGLLEAFVQVASDGNAVLYVAYDIESCGPLASVAASHGLLGVGLVLASERSAQSVAQLSWAVHPGSKGEPTRADPGNARLVAGNAMASCLPLFEVLARGAGQVKLSLGSDSLLEIHSANAMTAAQ